MVSCSEEEIPTKRFKSDISYMKQQQEHISKYQSLLKIKLEKCDVTSTNHVKNNNTPTAKVLSSLQECYDADADENPKKNLVKDNVKTKMSIISAQKSSNNNKAKENENGEPAEGVDVCKSSPVHTNINIINNAEECTENVKNTEKKLQIKSIRKVHAAEDCKIKDIKLENLKKQYNEMKKKYKRAEEKIKNLKIDLADEIRLKKEFQDLNLIYQKREIEREEEQKIVDKQLDKAKPDVYIDYEKNFVPVGHRRECDETVHVGRKTWIPESIFDNINISCHTPSKCAGEIIIAIFGEKVLLKSTLSGKGSNKTAVKDSEINKLDPVKVAVCTEWYTHWVKTKYMPIHPKEDEKQILNDFKSHVSKKISYLKRPASTSGKGSKSKARKNELTVEAEVYSDPESVNNNTTVAVIEEKEKERDKCMENDIVVVNTEYVDVGSNELDIDEEYVDFFPVPSENDSDSDPDDPLQDANEEKKIEKDEEEVKLSE